MSQTVAAPLPEAPKRTGFQIAPSAVGRLLALSKQMGSPEGGLRIAIRGGGCSGLSYVMEWADKPKERDKVFERDGARVFIDSKSHLYLMSAELSFEESFMQSSFKLNNPQAKSSCGCGESFSL
jgi:iron-sulfur cluster assembly protein